MPILFRTTGTLATPQIFVQRDGGARAARVPIACAIIVRPDGIALIDTGWSRSQAAWPERDPGALATALRGTRVRPEDAMASQLISLGLDPGEVRNVFATHLFEDHIGGAVDFPNAVIHATYDEWESRRRARRAGYASRPAPYASRLNLHSLAGPPALGFAASHDVFGDGTVLLLDAAGHSRGGLAVAVKLEDGGWLLHVGDAAVARAEWEAEGYESVYGRFAATDRAARTRVLRTIGTAAREHGARVVASHDAQGFAELPTTMDKALRGAWDTSANASKKNANKGANKGAEKSVGKGAEKSVKQKRPAADAASGAEAPPADLTPPLPAASASAPLPADAAR